VKGKLKQNYAQLTDDDFTYSEGKDDELIGKLQKKLGKSAKEVRKVLEHYGCASISVWTRARKRLSKLPQILHILLVEDHDDTRRAMEVFLLAHGHLTEVAAGVQEAVDLAATSDSEFDLLLSDIQLPDGNGWDLLRRLEEGGWRPQLAIA
jgi:uncharacterized protein YjbJ (UPF0337 family)